MDTFGPNQLRGWNTGHECVPRSLSTRGGLRREGANAAFAEDLGLDDCDLAAFRILLSNAESTPPKTNVGK